MPAFSSAALEEWNGHVEAMLRGVAHALNNRAAALSASIQLARDPDDGPAGSVVGAILEPELERVTELATAARLIGAPRGGDEAFSPRDAAGDALLLLKLYADQHERHVAIDAHAASPVRTQRWMFVRALVVLGGGASATDARITIADDGPSGDAIVVRCPGARAASTYVGELATAMGGAPLDEGAGFRIPTLAALRRGEGR